MRYVYIISKHYPFHICTRSSMNVAQIIIILHGLTVITSKWPWTYKRSSWLFMVWQQSLLNDREFTTNHHDYSWFDSNHSQMTMNLSQIINHDYSWFDSNHYQMTMNLPQIIMIIHGLTIIASKWPWTYHDLYSSFWRISLRVQWIVIILLSLWLIVNIHKAKTKCFNYLVQYNMVIVI